MTGLRRLAGVLIRTVVATAGLCWPHEGYCEAGDTQPSIRKETHIPAEDLSAALTTLGEDRHIELIFVAEDVRGTRTRGASGNLTLEEALERILAGTGLTYHYFDRATVTIVPAQGITRAQGINRDGDASVKHPLDRTPPGKPATVDEVVVTARKRPEGLQDVPVSVSVISGTTLEEMGATQLSDYASYAPGLTAVPGPTSGQDILVLRGLDLPTPAALVGTYIDDSPVGASYPNLFSLRLALDLEPYDLERVEVLEGPQGTLYGANTIGGLVKYVTRKPEFDVTAVRVGADFKENATASAAGWNAHGSLNLPIAGQSALRVSFSQDLTPGFVDDPYQHRTNGNELRDQSGHIAFAERFADAWSLEVAALTQDQYSPGSASVTLTENFMPDTGRRLSDSDVVPETFKSTLRYYSADIDGDLGWASFKSATSYSQQHWVTLEEGYYPYNLVTGRGNGLLAYSLKKLTQEFRLASPSDRDLEWLLGVFYTNEQGDDSAASDALDTSNRVIPNPQLNPQAAIFTPSRYQEYALFGDATWNLTRALDLTLGLRESRNEQIFGEFLTCSSVFLSTTQGTCSPERPIGGTLSQGVLNFAVSSRYRFSSEAMAYLRVASGYRPGAPSPGLKLRGIPSLKADTSIDTEVGIKSRLGHWAQLNVALYQIDWRHIQIPAQTPPPLNGSYIGNGNAAIVRGLEAAGVLAPLSQLNLRLNVTYTHAVLSEPMPANSVLVGDRGNRLPYTPLWSGSLTAEYVQPLRHGWQGKLNAGWRYIGQRYTTVNNNANCPLNCNGLSSVPSLRPYGAFDLHASVSNDSWTMRFAARNLTNKYAIVDISAGGAPSYDPAPIVGTLLSGRLLTVGVERRF